MWQNFVDSVNIVLPIFILVSLGYILKRVNFISQKFCDDADKIVFDIMLPCQLFATVATSGGGGESDGKLIVFVVCGVTTAFLAGLTFGAIFIKDRAACGAVVQNLYRSNFAILGIPLAYNLAGDEGLRVIAIMMPFVIIMYNAYSVIELNIFAPKEHKQSVGKIFLQILKSVVTNPLIISVVLGLPFMLTGWYFPENSFVTRTITSLSNVTEGLILIVLGANFSFASLRGKIKYSLPASIYKTAVLPFIGVLAARAFGFEGVQLALIFIMFGTPSAVTSYIMAKRMKSDGDVASQILIISTLLCILTLFLGIFILKNLGWI